MVNLRRPYALPFPRFWLPVARHADPELAAAAVSGRIGGHPEALLSAYRPALETMQQVLAAGKAVKQPLLELPVALA